MNTQQIELVQRTFALAAPMADEIADRFYDRLFELDPSLRSLFRGDIQQQGTKLMTMLALAVRSLDRPETILEPVRRLGERHVQYGVQPHHYATVGEALLWTLAQLFGPAFTADVEDAWTAAYQLLAGVMQEAAAEGVTR
jgi:hemoglobin-like flavoprotein